jgi:Zn-dependent alcohol dehydrogenase
MRGVFTIRSTKWGTYPSIFMPHQPTDIDVVVPRFCPASAEIGLKLVDGAFADYSLLDAKYTVKIPDTMSFEQAAPMSCAGVTIYHSIKACGLKPGQVRDLPSVSGV